MSMRRPTNLRPPTDHVCKDVRRNLGSINQLLDLVVAGVVDAKAFGCDSSQVFSFSVSFGSSFNFVLSFGCFGFGFKSTIRG